MEGHFKRGVFDRLCLCQNGPIAMGEKNGGRRKKKTRRFLVVVVNNTDSCALSDTLSTASFESRCLVTLCSAKLLL